MKLLAILFISVFALITGLLFILRLVRKKTADISHVGAPHAARRIIIFLQYALYFIALVYFFIQPFVNVGSSGWNSGEGSQHILINTGYFMLTFIAFMLTMLTSFPYVSEVSQSKALRLKKGLVKGFFLTVVLFLFVLFAGLAGLFSPGSKPLFPFSELLSLMIFLMLFCFAVTDFRSNISDRERILTETVVPLILIFVSLITTYIYWKTVDHRPYYQHGELLGSGAFMFV
jgi:hypothetical protein